MGRYLRRYILLQFYLFDQSDKIFYSIDNEANWINTSFDGSLLMRPIFATKLNITLGENELSFEDDKTYVFPNPSTGIFSIRTNSTSEKIYEVYDLKGQLILKTNQKTIDLSTNESGIYFLKDTTTSKTHKLIKN